ncbi:MAG: hypothetical protein ACRD19_04800 [Terriglobia bacterium]
MQPSQKRLPERFHDLERYLEWALLTEQARTAKRHASSMQEIRAFYDAMVDRLEEILQHLNGFTLENVPDDTNTLLLLTMSLAEVAPAVENFGQPDVVDGYHWSRFVPVHE